MDSAENVGGCFPAEARVINDGDSPERLIHGEATIEEATALAEDSVAECKPLTDRASGFDQGHRRAWPFARASVAQTLQIYSIRPEVRAGAPRVRCRRIDGLRCGRPVPRNQRRRPQGGPSLVSISFPYISTPQDRNWCGREDSNFHGLSATTTSTLRVYQFRHDRLSPSLWR